MKGFVQDIEGMAIKNENFRRVLYTLYSPPNHRDGVVHATRADAQADNEHFSGKTTE